MALMLLGLLKLSESVQRVHGGVGFDELLSDLNLNVLLGPWKAQ